MSKTQNQGKLRSRDGSKNCCYCGESITGGKKSVRMCKACVPRHMSELHKAHGRSPQIYRTAESEKKRKAKLASGSHREKLSESLTGRKLQTPITKQFSKQHWRAVKTIFRSPDNVVYEVCSITAFVVENPHLFPPETLINKHKGNGFECNAVNGLSHVHTGSRGSWRGWTKVSYTETFYNGGESLLAAEIKH